jgi:tape measure domain-containing protein
MVVRELVTRLGFQLNQAQLNNAEQATQRLQQRAEVAANTFRNMFAAFAGFATVKAIVNIGDEMQSIQARIGMLPQTVGEAAAAFDEVAKHATTAGVPLAAYAKLYTRIGNGAKDYVKTQGELLGITDTISNALKVGGATTAEASSTMLQFAQALGSGVLQGDEFRAMAEAAPQYLDKLAESMGIPREQLKKMASEGKLTTKAVIEATKKMADYFEQRAKEMPATVGGAITAAANKWAAGINKMNEATGFIPKFAAAIIAANDAIIAFAKGIIKRFGGIAETVQFGIATISAAITAWLVPALYAARVAMWAAFKQFLVFAAIVAVLALVIEDLWSYFNDGNSVIGQWIEYIQSGTASANTFIGVLGALGLAALVSGARMAAGWLMAMGPIGLVIAGLTSIAALMYKISQNSDIPGVGEFDAMGNPTGIGPADMAGGGSGGNNTVNKTTNVSVTVPAGTTADQAAFLNTAAQKAFAQDDGGTARDLAMIGP